jgi:hypothetical protein
MHGQAGVPSFVAAVAIGATVNKGRKLRRNRGNAGGERPGSRALTASSCWHRWTVVAAFFAFFALRTANLYPKVDDDHDGVNVWEFIGGSGGSVMPCLCMHVPHMSTYLAHYMLMYYKG